MGALIGGILADLYQTRILKLFALFEFAIGFFGICSPYIINWVGDHFVNSGPVEIALTNFCLLLFPTLLMGATLPMLVIHINKTLNHIGASIGSLYFVNTLGAAFGSLLAGFFLFDYFTLSQTIYFAVSINVIVGTLVSVKLVKWNPA